MPSGGQYQFRVVPFCLNNAPGTFQNFMRHVLAEFWGEFAIAYLDDIIVYSDNWTDHLRHLALTFKRLEMYGLTCSPIKCKFGKTTLPYLGRMINEDSNTPQGEHLKTILAVEPPATHKPLQSLVGTLNWLNEYVPNFAEMIAPMTDLLSPTKPYKWGPDAQTAQDNIKIAVSLPRALSRPNPALPFILQTDASAKGMGAVLMHKIADGKRKIISYASTRRRREAASILFKHKPCATQAIYRRRRAAESFLVLHKLRRRRQRTSRKRKGVTYRGAKTNVSKEK